MLHYNTILLYIYIYCITLLFQQQQQQQLLCGVDGFSVLRGGGTSRSTIGMFLYSAKQQQYTNYDYYYNVYSPTTKWNTNHQRRPSFVVRNSIIPRRKVVSSSSTSTSSSSSTSLSMCICIHCSRVTNCAAYHFVETKHEQPHMTDNPTFTPREGSPTIHVNVRTHRTNNNELQRLWKEHEQQTAEAMANPEQQQRLEDGKYIGSNKYDLSPQTTVEYDVVACADFIEDKDCWVRNMPDVIRQANPNFVPT
jgi:hypothetical protein